MTWKPSVRATYSNFCFADKNPLSNFDRSLFVNVIFVITGEPGALLSALSEGFNDAMTLSIASELSSFTYTNDTTMVHFDNV